VMSAYAKMDDDETVFGKDDALVKLTNIPPTMSANYLVHNLFPKDDELGSIYGTLSSEDVVKTTATEAIVRLQSAEQAESAVSSALLRQRLEELGASRLRYFKAKRELVFAGFMGPNKGEPYQERGRRLVVSGDKPPDKFFQNHGAVLQLRRVDLSITKQEISDFFQSFCTRDRDVVGSVEFVVCAEGDRTDKVYVGFDRADEMKEAIKACGGLINLGKGSISVRSMKDKWVPRSVPAEVRPERSEEELLASLQNWEDYVDPKDVEELEALGVHRHVFEDAFRTMRYHNSTYGPMDWSMNREKLTPERSEPGQHMRETMKLFVETLKECIATPENPGEIYKSLFVPGEEIDVTPLEVEQKRLDRVAEERALLKRLS